MAWQDIVISVCQLFVVISLIPSITSSDKPALKTCAMSLVIVLVIASTLLTLKLWLAAITAYMIAVAWAILTTQKFKIDKKS